jgi:penicillin-binding protein 1C
LVGIQTAAPLFFQIVDSLRSQGLDSGELASAAPANLSRVKVCAASGDLPNAHCKDLSETWFIPGKSPIKLSTLHRAVQIDIKTGLATCATGPGSRQEVFEYWGSDMMQLFAQAGIPRRIPPRPAHCTANGTNDLSGDGPHIVSPLEGANYILRIQHPTPLLLRANANKQGTIYWFSDSAYLGTTISGQDLLWQPPQAGRYTLTSVDETGASDTRVVAVEFAP